MARGRAVELKSSLTTRCESFAACVLAVMCTEVVVSSCGCAFSANLANPANSFTLRVSQPIDWLEP